jgi:signal transduction histidine kinase
MQTLSHCLIQIQESERRHLARELHDEMGQALTAVKIHLQEIEGVSNNTAVLNDVHESIAIVEKILNQVRSLSIDLRPLLLDDLGLVATLRWYVSRQSQLGGFTIHFAASPEKMNLSGDLETACFRIVQEAITNIIRHSQAKKVHVEITQLHEELSLLVRDDGIGFDVEAAQKRSSQGLSMGLLGMRERVALLAGQMEIESVSTYGTEIRVRFPIPAVIGTIA